MARRPGPRERFHTETFERIDSERREALLRVAIREFAENGYAATGINTLAKKAGISIGSLYSYFPSKEALFLTIIDRGHDLLEEALSKIDEELGLFSAIESMLRLALESARREPEMHQIYLDSTTQGLRSLSARLSSRIESVTAALYARLFARAMANGELRPDIDPGAAAFCMDNIVLMFQFSFASDYYRDRLRIFLGLPEDAAIDEERLISAIVGFARRAFGPAAPLR